MRCRECLDGRHPQDFIRALPEHISPPWARNWVAPTTTGVWINNASEIIPWSGLAGNIILWT